MNHHTLSGDCESLKTTQTTGWAVPVHWLEMPRRRVHDRQGQQRIQVLSGCPAFGGQPPLPEGPATTSSLSVTAENSPRQDTGGDVGERGGGGEVGASGEGEGVQAV